MKRNPASFSSLNSFFGERCLSREVQRGRGSSCDVMLCPRAHPKPLQAGDPSLSRRTSLLSLLSCSGAALTCPCPHLPQPHLEHPSSLQNPAHKHFYSCSQALGGPVA